MEYLPAKTLVTRTRNQEWFGVDYNMNIYRGCSFGCIYCDSRSLCYQIEQFDAICAKKDALDIIRNDLLKKRRRGVIATGAMSDPYNPAEKELKLTRGALEIINTCRFGIAIATKSSLVCRDADILNDIQKHSPALVKITITAADDTLSKMVEPRAPPSSERFNTIKALSSHGIYTGVLMMPVLPFIEDTEENIIKIVRMAKENGARFIYPAFGVTLRAGNREYFYKNLDTVFPGLKDRYIKRYGERYNCTSFYAGKLWKIFCAECTKQGLHFNMQEIITGYKQKYAVEQLSLF